MGDWLFGGGGKPAAPGKVFHQQAAEPELDKPHLLERCITLNGKEEIEMACNLCPHGAGLQTCVRCFHERQQAAPNSKPKPRPELPKSYVQRPTGPNAAVVEEVKRATASQGPPGPVHMGTLPSGQPVPPPQSPAKKGKYPQPVFRGAANGAQPGQAAVKGPPEPFSYANNPGRTDSKGYWHPPKHESLIDRLPRHPDPNGTGGKTQG